MLLTNSSAAPQAGSCDLLAVQEERADLRMIAGELGLLQHRIQQLVLHAGLRSLEGWLSWLGFTSKNSTKSATTKGVAEKIRETHGVL